MPRLNKETRTKEQIQEAFLKHLEECGNITMAAKKARIARKQIYRWKESDNSFLEAFNVSAALGVDLLEDEAQRRAYHGTQKPIYQGGKLVGKVQEFSDTLLIFLLKGKKPEVYKDRHEHTGKDGKPIAVEYEITLKI